jgi:D-inositol-3-phosphate glycosyltransferase
MPDRSASRRPRDKLNRVEEMKPAALRIAMISVHSSPLGPLGAQDTGGMSVYIRELSRELGRLGHRVDIFTGAGDPAGGHAPHPLHPNVRLVRLPLGAGRKAPKAELHAHLPHFAQALAGFYDRTGAGCDLIHSHYWLSGRVGEMIRADRDLPHIVTFHTLGALKDEALGLKADPTLRVAAERDLTETCDRIVVTSRREQANLTRFYGAAAARVRVVPCGVDPALFRPLDRQAARRGIGVGDNERVVLYVGRFAPEKGLERLLRAVALLAHLPRLRLVVVGGEGDADPQAGRMRALAQSAGVADRVLFTGRVEHTELPAFYSAANTLALPSSYESFGMVGLEALACGTPVAATRVGAMDELITPGRDGWIADGFTPAALAQAIERTLALPEAATDDGRARIRRAALGCSWSRVAREVLQVYRGALPGMRRTNVGGLAQPALAVHAEEAR